MAAAAARDQQTDWSSRTIDILLIDDNKMDVELFRHALSRQGDSFTTHVLEEGDHALAFLREHIEKGLLEDIPKMILIDVNLPRTPGVEVLRQIKQEARLRLIPVVMWSAMQTKEVVGQCYDAGANSFVVKPINFEAFQELSKVIVPYWVSLNQLPEGV